MSTFEPAVPEASNHPLLSIQDIHKQFGYKQVLKGVSLQLSAGEIMLLAGRNGAGKSTLIKILAGLMQPSKGKVFFEGVPLEDTAKLYRGSFGLITHHTLFYNDLTARENLLVFGKLRKIPELKKKIENVLMATGLEKAGNLQVKAFSSGMGKRLNIARIMMAEPKILFLDEPYSGLDVHSIDLLNDYLMTFKKSGGSTLLISHQIDACFDKCDNVAMLTSGTVTRVVPVSELDQTGFIRQFQNDNYG